MKKICGLLGLVLVLVSCQEQQKIAFINNAEVVNQFQKKVDFEKVFQSKIDVFNKKADSLEKAIQIEAQLFQSKAQKMSQRKAEEEYQALLQKKQMQDYQIQTEEKSLQAEGQKKIDSLINEVKDFVKEYGKKHNYTYILGANDAGSVMYGMDESDLTDVIIKALNDTYSSEK